MRTLLLIVATACVGVTPTRAAAYWAMGAILQVQHKHSAQVRALYREAAAGAFERMRSFVDFTPAAQGELRKYRPLFGGQVRAAWI